MEKEFLTSCSMLYALQFWSTKARVLDGKSAFPGADDSEDSNITVEES